VKSHYIFGLIEVKGTVVHPLDIKIYFVVIIFFLVLVISGQLTLYKLIKKHLDVPGTYEDQMTNGGRNTTTNARGEETPTKKFNSVFLLGPIYLTETKILISHQKKLLGNFK